MYALILQIVLYAFKYLPEVVSLAKTMHESGQDTPTQDQLDGLKAAHASRTDADTRWDDFPLAP